MRSPIPARSAASKSTIQAIAGSSASASSPTGASGCVGSGPTASGGMSRPKTTLTGRPPEDRTAYQRSGRRRRLGRSPPRRLVVGEREVGERRLHRQRTVRRRGLRGPVGGVRRLRAARDPRRPRGPEAVRELLPGGRSGVLVSAGAPVLRPVVASPILLARGQVRFVGVEVHRVGEDAYEQLDARSGNLGEAGLEPHGQQEQRTVRGKEDVVEGRGRVGEMGRRERGGGAERSSGRHGFRRARRVGRRGTRCGPGGGAACRPRGRRCAPRSARRWAASAGAGAVASSHATPAGAVPASSPKRGSPACSWMTTNQPGSVSEPTTSSASNAKPNSSTSGGSDARNAGSTSSAGSELGTRSDPSGTARAAYTVAFG